MPAGPLDFRPKCGSFFFVFLAFMDKRVGEVIAMRVRVLTVRTRSEGVMVGLVLAVLWTNDLLMRCGDVEQNPGPLTNEKDLRQPQRTTRQSSADRRAPTPNRAEAGAGKEPTLTDVMASIQTLNASLESKFEDLKSEVVDIKNSHAILTEEVQGLRNEVTDLKRINDDLLNENEEMKTRIGSLERATDDLEGRSRRNNLLFFGFHRHRDETNEDLEGRVQELLTDQLELAEDVAFDRVHRLGSGPNAPVIARCSFFKQKVAILKAKAKLQNQNSGVSIAEDFTQRVREVRKKLIPHLKKAKEEGKRATLVYDHLLIESRKYCLGEDDKLVDMS